MSHAVGLSLVRVVCICADFRTTGKFWDRCSCYLFCPLWYNHVT